MLAVDTKCYPTRRGREERWKGCNTIEHEFFKERETLLENQRGSRGDLFLCLFLSFRHPAFQSYLSVRGKQGKISCAEERGEGKSLDLIYE